MTKFKTLLAGAILAGALASTSAQAVVTTFASFSPIGQGANVRWQNSVGSSSGTGGSFYSIAGATGTTSASRAVSFSFLQPQLSAQVTGVTAIFTLNASAPTGNGVTTAGTFLIQDGISGSFSFISTSAITINNTVYAAGSNLLTGTFGQAGIAGQRLGTAASFSGSTGAGDTLVYTSDFLDFSQVIGSDFAISLTSVASPLQAAPTGPNPTSALRTFRAVASGTFSTDPAPLVNAVPEPEAWALMVVGFGLVGVSLRRRKSSLAAIAA